MCIDYEQKEERDRDEENKAAHVRFVHRHKINKSIPKLPLLHTLPTIMNSTFKGKKKASCPSLRKMRKLRKEKIDNSWAGPETICTYTSAPVVDDDIHKCTIQFSTLDSSLTENPFAFFPKRSGTRVCSQRIIIKIRKMRR